MRTNTTKAKLAAGQVVFGAIISRHAPDQVELFGAIGYDFVSELLATGQVSDAAFARVKATFGERGVMDLVGAVGYYSLVSMVLNVARVPLPAGVEPPLK